MMMVDSPDPTPAAAVRARQPPCGTSARDASRGSPGVRPRPGRGRTLLGRTGRCAWLAALYSSSCQHPRFDAGRQRRGVVEEDGPDPLRRAHRGRPNPPLLCEHPARGQFPRPLAARRGSPRATDRCGTRPQDEKTSSTRSSRPARSGERSVCPRPKVSVAASTPPRWRWIETVSAIGSTNQYSDTPCLP